MLWPFSFELSVLVSGTGDNAALISLSPSVRETLVACWVLPLTVIFLADDGVGHWLYFPAINQAVIQQLLAGLYVADDGQVDEESVHITFFEGHRAASIGFDVAAPGCLEGIPVVFGLYFAFFDQQRCNIIIAEWAQCAVFH